MGMMGGAPPEPTTSNNTTDSTTTSATPAAAAGEGAPPPNSSNGATTTTTTTNAHDSADNFVAMAENSRRSGASSGASREDPSGDGATTPSAGINMPPTARSSGSGGSNSSTLNPQPPPGKSSGGGNTRAGSLSNTNTATATDNAQQQQHEHDPDDYHYAPRSLTARRNAISSTMSAETVYDILMQRKRSEEEALAAAAAGDQSVSKGNFLQSQSQSYQAGGGHSQFLGNPVVIDKESGKRRVSLIASNSSMNMSGMSHPISPAIAITGGDSTSTQAHNFFAANMHKEGEFIIARPTVIASNTTSNTNGGNGSSSQQQQQQQQYLRHNLIGRFPLAAFPQYCTSLHQQLILITITPEGKVLSWNGAASRASHYKEKDIHRWQSSKSSRRNPTGEPRDIFALFPSDEDKRNLRDAVKNAIAAAATQSRQSQQQQHYNNSAANSVNQQQQQSPENNNTNQHHPPAVLKALDGNNTDAPLSAAADTNKTANGDENKQEAGTQQVSPLADNNAVNEVNSGNVYSLLRKDGLSQAQLRLSVIGSVASATTRLHGVSDLSPLSPRTDKTDDADPDDPFTSPAPRGGGSAAAAAAAAADHSMMLLLVGEEVKQKPKAVADLDGGLWFSEQLEELLGTIGQPLTSPKTAAAAKGGGGDDDLASAASSPQSGTNAAGGLPSFDKPDTTKKKSGDDTADVWAQFHHIKSKNLKCGDLMTVMARYQRMVQATTYSDNLAVVPIRDLAHRVVTKSQKGARAKEVHLSLQTDSLIPESFFCDTTALPDILEYLITNTVKNSRIATHIRLKIKFMVEDGLDFIAFAVETDSKTVLDHRVIKAFKKAEKGKVLPTFATSKLNKIRVEVKDMAGRLEVDDPDRKWTYRLIIPYLSVDDVGEGDDDEDGMGGDEDGMVSNRSMGLSVLSDRSMSVVGGVGGLGNTISSRPQRKRVTTVLVETQTLHRNTLCTYLWDRKHAVLPCQTTRDFLTQVKTANIILVDPSQYIVEDAAAGSGVDFITLLQQEAPDAVVIITSTTFSSNEGLRETYQSAGFLTLSKPCTAVQAQVVLKQAEAKVAIKREEADRIAKFRALFQEGSERNENWTRGRKLGQGSYGEVWEAFDGITGGKMAVKILKLKKDQDKQAVLSEIQVMCELRQRNIVHYFYAQDVVEENAIHVFMECAGGGTLQDKIKDKPMTDLTQLSHYLKGILEGLMYVHESGYIHSDIKTANVFFAEDVPKLGDFGTARRVEPGGKLYIMEGSPLYMAPEVLSADKEEGIGFDFKADIWSLGAVVLEMYTGQPPFSHLNKKGLALISYISDLTDFPDLSVLFDNVPVFDFCRACMSVDPDKRPTARELLDFPLVTSPEGGGEVGLMKKELLMAQMVHTLNKYVAFEDDEVDLMSPRSTQGGGGGESMFRFGQSDPSFDNPTSMVSASSGFFDSDDESELGSQLGSMSMTQSNMFESQRENVVGASCLPPERTGEDAFFDSDDDDGDGGGGDGGDDDEEANGDAHNDTAGEPATTTDPAHQPFASQQQYYHQQQQHGAAANGGGYIPDESQDLNGMGLSEECGAALAAAHGAGAHPQTAPSLTGTPSSSRAGQMGQSPATLGGLSPPTKNLYGGDGNHNHQYHSNHPGSIQDPPTPVYTGEVDAQGVPLDPSSPSPEMPTMTQMTPAVVMLHEQVMDIMRMLNTKYGAGVEINDELSRQQEERTNATLRGAQVPTTFKPDLVNICMTDVQLLRRTHEKLMGAAGDTEQQQQGSDK